MTRFFYFLTLERILKTHFKFLFKLFFKKFIFVQTFSSPVKFFVKTFSRTSLEVPLKSLNTYKGL